MIAVHPHIGYLNTEFRIQFNDNSNYQLVDKEIVVTNSHGEFVDNLIIPLNSNSILHKFSSAGEYTLCVKGHEEKVNVCVKDAIRFGGSTHKNSYVFDKTPWCFIVMKDRTYFYNRETTEEYVEAISPDIIEYVNHDVVSFYNKGECSLYSLSDHKIIVSYRSGEILNENTLIISNFSDDKINQNDQCQETNRYESTIQIKAPCYTKNKKKNVMTAAQLKEQRKDVISIIEYKGKTFFTCGREANGDPMYGYVTKKVYKGLCDGTANISNIEYAEVETEDGKTIPCLMMASNNEKFSSNTRSAIKIIRFVKNILGERNIACDKYMLSDNGKTLYILAGATIKQIAIDSLNISIVETSGYKPIDLINGHYAIGLDEKGRILIYDLSTSKVINRINENWTISAINGMRIIDVKNIENEFAKVYQQLINSKSYRNIELALHNLSVDNIRVVGNYVYYVVTDNKQWVNQYGDVKHSTDVCIKCCNRSSFNVPISRCLETTVVHNSLYIKGSQRCVVAVNGELVYETKDKYYCYGNLVVFISPTEQSDEIYVIENGKKRQLLKGKFDYSLFNRYGLIIETSKSRIYRFDGIGDNGESYKIIDVLSNRISIKTIGSHSVIVIDWTSILRNQNIVQLPEAVCAISNDFNHTISIKGSHIYLGAYEKGDYNCSEILEGLYDTTSYGKVFLTDDGENIVYQKGKLCILKNIQTGEESTFPNLSFVEHVNGYRPLIKNDHWRKPRIIDPITKQEINADFLANYNFVSPQGDLLADAEQKIKYFHNGNEINKTEVEKIRRELDLLDLCDKETIIRNRRAYIAEHKSFFREKNENSLLSEPIFSKNIIKTTSYIIIKRCNGTNQDNIEINIGPTLWFLNYVSFSYNSRYVAIAGRYPDNTFNEAGASMSGLFLIYDVVEERIVFKSTSSYAVWCTAFTKDGIVAAYSSEPNTYIHTCPYDGQVTEIKGKSFMTFSPDGRYVALSKQGYVRYNGGEYGSCWGHMPSTEVYLYSIEKKNDKIVYSQVLPTINDLSENGIAGVCTRSASISFCSFSYDNKKLMMVGNDGVVIIRNIYVK